MPRPRQHPLFELGEFWIGREPTSPLLYRYWRDRDARRTKRATLGTDDLEEAKIRLAEIVLRAQPVTTTSELAAIFDKYCDEHGDKTETGKTARGACRLFLECWGKAATVATVTEENQKKFAQWGVDEHGFALATIYRHLTTLSAALRHSGITVKVFANQALIRDKWRIVTKPPRRVYIPTDDEMRRLWKTPMPENLRRWLLISMCTGCRPAAALDVSSASRRRDAELLDLLPADRVQNKKRRPTVRVPPILTAAMDDWDKDKVKNAGGHYSGYTNYAGVAQALERVCAEKKANIPALTTYSIRHKVATVLRAAKVPKELRKAQMGHVDPEDRVSDGYGEYDPDYLKEATDALESWARRIVGRHPVKSQDSLKTGPRQKRSKK
jgi:hypothetical protein